MASMNGRGCRISVRPEAFLLERNHCVPRCLRIIAVHAFDTVLRFCSHGMSERSANMLPLFSTVLNRPHLRLACISKCPGDVLNGQQGPLFALRWACYYELWSGLRHLLWTWADDATLHLLHAPQQPSVRFALSCDARLTCGNVLAALAQSGPRLVPYNLIGVAGGVRILGSAL